MWLLYIPEAFVDDMKVEPSPGQRDIEKRARALASELKRTLEHLTVRQQRDIIEEIAEWGAFKSMRPIGEDDFPELEK